MNTPPAATAHSAQPPCDLPAHVVRLARMIARDCAAPGQYTVRIIVPQFPMEPVEIQTARVEVIRNGEADRK